MVIDTHFNSATDIMEVDQFGFVDVNKAIQNGYVPGSSGVTDLDYDDCTDPSAIIGKPKDVFEAIRMQDNILNGISKGNSISVGSSEDKHE